MTIVSGYDDNYQERTSNASLQRESLKMDVKVKVCIYLNIKKFQL